MKRRAGVYHGKIIDFWAPDDSRGFVGIQAFTPTGNAFIAHETLSKGAI